MRKGNLEIGTFDFELWSYNLRLTDGDLELETRNPQPET